MPIKWPFRRIPDLTALAQQHTEDAVNLLVEAIKDENFASYSRVRAAAVLLDRGWGRVGKALEKNPNPAGDLSDAELRVAIEYVRERVAEQEAEQEAERLQKEATEATAKDVAGEAPHAGTPSVSAPAPGGAGPIGPGGG